MDTELYEYLELWFRNTGQLYEDRKNLVIKAKQDSLVPDDVSSLINKAWFQLHREGLHTYHNIIINSPTFERLLAVCILNDVGYLEDHI